MLDHSGLEERSRIGAVEVVFADARIRALADRVETVKAVRSMLRCAFSGNSALEWTGSPREDFCLPRDQCP